MDRGRDSAKRHPSLQTGRADFPHPAFRSVGSLSRGSGSSPRPQGRQPDARYPSSHMRSTGSTVGEPLRALSLVCHPVFRLSSFHLPTSLRSTVVTRFSATTDALTPASQARGLFAQRAHQHWRVSLVIASRLPSIPSPTLCVLTEGCPVASRFCPPRQASSLPSRLAHSRRPNRVHGGCLTGQPM